MQLTQTLLSLLGLLLLLPALLAAQPIASPTLEKRGKGWIEGRGGGAYKCMYWNGLFFDQYHMAGVRADFGEKELKKIVKTSGAMTGWKYKQDGPGSYKADWNLPKFTWGILSRNLDDLTGARGICGFDG